MFVQRTPSAVDSFNLHHTFSDHFSSRSLMLHPRLPFRPNPLTPAPPQVLDAASKAARDGAEATKAMKAQAGRSAYVSDLQGVPDPGAVAVGVWLESLAAALNSP